MLIPLPFIGVHDQSAPEDLESAMASITLVIDNMITGAASLQGNILPVFPVLPPQPALRTLGTRLPEPSNDRFVQHRITPGKNSTEITPCLGLNMSERVIGPEGNEHEERLDRQR